MKIFALKLGVLANIIILFSCLNAWPETITVSGLVEFEDGDTITAAAAGGAYPALASGSIIIKPGRFVKVTIRSFPFFSILAQGHSDSRGYFNLTVDAPLRSSQMRIDFEVDNRFLQVWADTDCVNEKLLASDELLRFPTPHWTDINRRFRFTANDYQTITVGECLFSEYDADVAFSGALNVNHMIQTAFADISSNRDPREDDNVGKVDVEYCDNDWNQYSGTVVVTCHNSDDASNNGWDWAYVDDNIGHEYAHHLDCEISTGDVHNGSHMCCTEIDTTWFNDPEFAWSEGFADYYGSHLVENYPGMSKKGGINLENYCGTGGIENACGTGGSGVTWRDPRDNEKWIAVEGNVLAILWDLADELGSGIDAWDVVDGPAIEGHKQIIQIFDRELDSTALFTDAYDFRDFYGAWVGRSGTSSLSEGQPALDLIVNRLGIVPELRIISTIDLARKNASNAFIEANPALPADAFSVYDPTDNSLTINWEGSYLDVTAPLRFFSIRAAVSNLPRATNTMRGLATAPFEESVSATVDGIPVTFLTPTSISWLSVSGLFGTIRPGRLLPALIYISPFARDLDAGTWQARIPVAFTITRSDGSTFNQTRNIEFVYTVPPGNGPSDDLDADGLSNEQEVMLNGFSEGGCPDPRDRDSDGDGIEDGEEVNTIGTNPCQVDSDGDGFNDRVEELMSCLDPTIDDAGADPDGDGLTNADEMGGITDPCDDDTDDDGELDGSDTCPTRGYGDHADLDADGFGNVCDRDDDGDGTPDLIDEDPWDDSSSGVNVHEAAFERMEIPAEIFAVPDLERLPCDPRICDPPMNFARAGNRLIVLDKNLKQIDEIDASSIGLAKDSNLGAAFLFLPDLDNDNVRDIAIGAPGASNSEGLDRAGQVIVFSGKSMAELKRYEGKNAGARFGVSLDLIGNRILAVGAPGNPELAGKVHIIHLGNDRKNFQLTAKKQGDEFGTTLIALKLPNGLDSLAIGAPGSDGANPEVGAIYMVVVRPNEPAIRIAEGRITGDRFGQSLIYAGFHEGKGLSMVLVGSPSARRTVVTPSGEKVGAENVGEVLLVRLDGKRIWHRTGNAPGQLFGYSLAALGFKKGRTEAAGFLIGAPGSQVDNKADVGGIYLYDQQGKDKGFVAGIEKGAKLGHTIFLGPDLKGDGRFSIILGAGGTGHSIVLTSLP